MKKEAIAQRLEEIKRRAPNRRIRIILDNGAEVTGTILFTDIEKDEAALQDGVQISNITLSAITVIQHIKEDKFVELLQKIREERKKVKIVTRNSGGLISKGYIQYVLPKYDIVELKGDDLSTSHIIISDISVIETDEQ